MQEVINYSPHLVTITKLVMGLVATALLWLILAGLFVASVRKTMRLVPSECLLRPLGLLWLLLVPGITAIMAWVLLPFALPKSILAALREQGSESWKRAKALARTGFILCASGVLALMAFLWIVWLSHQDFQMHTVGNQGIIVLTSLLALVAVKIVMFLYYWYLIVALRWDLQAAHDRSGKSNCRSAS